MSSAPRQVVGLIDLPGDVSWSADALVRECLGSIPSTGSHDQVVIAGRLPGRRPYESGLLAADLYQLRTDLDQLLDSFLVHRPS